MGTPPFILDLRAMVGHHPLWLCGTTAVVRRGNDVLMVRRADSGVWTPVTGIVDPGEEPADAAAREVLEETGVVARVTRLALVHVTDPVTYANGDRTQYVDIVFGLEWESGDPHPADGENLEARWFARDALPDVDPDTRRRIEAGLSDGPAQFGSTRFGSTQFGSTQPGPVGS